jgi:hypothetical protein
MADLVPPIPIDAPFASYNWVDWYQKVRRAINEAQNLKWSQFTDFTGSNLTQIATRNHKDLQSLQGGTTNEYYHFTNAEHTTLAAAVANGITTTITTAKLTGGGTDGSMTFVNGILTASTPAT